MGRDIYLHPVSNRNKHMSNDHLNPLFRAIVEAHTPVYGVRVTKKMKQNNERPKSVDPRASDSLDKDA